MRARAPRRDDLLMERTVTARSNPPANLIRTPDQRLRVFVSSALQELAGERQAAQEAITGLRLVPVLFELGARPHPARNVYRAYLAQSQVFVGIYWQSYGWVPSGEEVSGLEDEYVMSAGLPRLIYVKHPAPDRDPRLARLLGRIRDEGDVSYQRFSDPAELRRLVGNDLAVLLSERFSQGRAGEAGPGGEAGEMDQPPAMLPPARLPTPPTPLLGREQDVATVRDMVLREDARLVSFTGPGGVGKSRLALAVAERLGPHVADGARLVDLAPVQEPDLVMNAIGAALGLRTSDGPLIDDLKAYLGSRRLVLLLDNFEQVTDAAPVIGELLAAAPGLTVLVTSRSALRLSGEHEFPVEPLPTPAAARDAQLARIRHYASVQLFLERAHAVAPGFELTSENAHAVAEICRRLDGLPLAIELAAARVRLLPPGALLARLDDRLNLLTGGPRDLPERQRTLRNTLDWSFDLLPADEQRLFRRLCVFPGTFNLEAAEDVCGEAGAEEIINTLSALMDASLVRSADRSGQPRFSLLETIRDYARECLRESGEWTAAHDRHAAHFMALAVAAEPGLAGTSQVAWLDRLETEHHNLAATMTWYLGQHQTRQAHQLGRLTWRYWWFRGHSEEIARYGQLILDQGDRMPPEEIGYAETGVGYMLIASGNQPRARELLEQSLARFRSLGDKFGIAITASALGRLAVLREDYPCAGEMLGESLALQQELGNQALVALTYNFLGQIPRGQGDNVAAAPLFAKGLAAARQVPDVFPLLVLLYNVAVTSEALDDVDGAARVLREGVAVANDTGDETSVAYYLRRLATVAERQDDPERAVSLLAAADVLLQATGTGWLRAYTPADSPEGESVSRLRARAGDAAFEEIWARGAAMGRLSAVAYALQG
jgi:predicted ATPase